MACPTRASIPGVDVDPVSFAYEIAGCVNGAQAALRIEGSVARGEVRFQAKRVSPEEPLLWDETILALTAIDPVILMALFRDVLRPDSAPEIFRVESGLFDYGEIAFGRLVLSGSWSVVEKRIVIQAQVVEGFLNLEPMERVTHVDVSSPMSVLSTEAGSVVATRTWAVGTSRGNSYSGTSVSRRRPLALEQAEDCVLRIRWTESAGSAVSDGRAARVYRVAVEGDARS